MAARTGHGWWPYWLPFFGFLGVLQFAGWLPEALEPWTLPLSVCVPGGLLVYFLARGEYPELRGPSGGAGGAALDALVGVAGGILWMAPYALLLWSRSPLWDALPDWLRPSPDDPFDPQQLGVSWVWLTLGLRTLGYGLVTPFVEELFIRSWLMRYAEVLDRRGDFRDVPVAHFSWRSLAIVLVFFTIGHVPWEWPVAVLWVLGTQLWFYRRRHLAALVRVHAASNLFILGFVWATDGHLVDAAGAPLDLWFFL
jgi:hypothetical protein